VITTWMACPVARRSIGSGPVAPADNPRASFVLARVNGLHSRYKISNEDYFFTLGLFMFSPE
ncbi:hypothetical protein B0H14DRAFT_2259869, partial [Mycena olivaceomarginata]